ncbi:MAG: ribonuclease III [Deltaproteobacteria bacterium]|nr:ribonuclease III [Deltaproteobacteria bacterium]
MDSKTRQALEEIIGYCFKEPTLAEQALTHSSFANEAPEADEVCHNERLEFLGDAVLNLVISEMLIAGCPKAQEGEMSHMRAFLVNKGELASTAASLDLGRFARLGKGEDRSGGRQKTSILADLFEAMLGAVFLDGGIEAARRMVRDALGERLEEFACEKPEPDPKSHLQEVLQSRGLGSPSYSLLEVDGPDHYRMFTVSAHLADEEIGRGSGRSKKAAEQAAASDALLRLKS